MEECALPEDKVNAVNTNIQLFKVTVHFHSLALSISNLGNYHNANIMITKVKGIL